MPIAFDTMQVDDGGGGGSGYSAPASPYSSPFSAPSGPNDATPSIPGPVTADGTSVDDPTRRRPGDAESRLVDMFAQAFGEQRVGTRQQIAPLVLQASQGSGGGAFSSPTAKAGVAIVGGGAVLAALAWWAFKRGAIAA
jgi:hypothetical protein